MDGGIHGEKGWKAMLLTIEAVRIMEDASEWYMLDKSTVDTECVMVKWDFWTIYSDRGIVLCLCTGIIERKKESWRWIMQVVSTALVREEDY